MLHLTSQEERAGSNTHPTDKETEAESVPGLPAQVQGQLIPDTDTLQTGLSL